MEYDQGEIERTTHGMRVVSWNLISGTRETMYFLLWVTVKIFAPAQPAGLCLPASAQTLLGRLCIIALTVSSPSSSSAYSVERTTNPPHLPVAHGSVLFFSQLSHCLKLHYLFVCYHVNSLPFHSRLFTGSDRNTISMRAETTLCGTCFRLLFFGISEVLQSL